LEDVLIRRLEVFTRLSSEDRAALERVTRNTTQVRARNDLISEGQRPTAVQLIVTGWACRYKMLPDGRRSIVAFFVPGDLCDVNVYVLREMDHSIGAVTNVRVAQIGRAELDKLMQNHPRVTQALWWHELVTAAVQREWTHNLASRTAYERIGHLLLELYLRVEAVGLALGDSCDFPLTQADLADATGLTSVHVNRTLQELRHDGLIELERRRLRIPDIAALMTASMFNPNYLHLGREGAHLNAND
jgi:CRP-like cAMP-binding protein